MANYYLTNKAIQDLSGIWNYTSGVWSEKQADKYYSMLLNFCKEIAINPQKGRRYDQLSSNILGCKTNQHIIFYRIVSTAEIEILRILHSSMDLRNRMQD